MLAESADEGPLLHAHLLGTVDFGECLALQNRLVYEVSGREDGRGVVLVCEHPPMISVGRGGSRGQIVANEHELSRRDLRVRWVNRGGGVVLHGPGQLAIYPIIPIGWHRLRVGDYMDRVSEALRLALADMCLVARRREPAAHDLWGRTGLLVQTGVAVKSWVTYFGAYCNLIPMRFPNRTVLPELISPWPSNLCREHQGPLRPAAVREAVVRRLAETLGFERVVVQAGHALLARPSNPVAQ